MKNLLILFSLFFITIDAKAQSPSSVHVNDFFTVEKSSQFLSFWGNECTILRGTIIQATRVNNRWIQLEALVDNEISEESKAHVYGDCLIYSRFWIMPEVFRVRLLLMEIQAIDATTFN